MKEFWDWIWADGAPNWRSSLGIVLLMAVAFAAMIGTGALVYHGFIALALGLWIAFPAWVLIHAFSREKRGGQK